MRHMRVRREGDDSRLGTCTVACRGMARVCCGPGPTQPGGGIRARGRATAEAGFFVRERVVVYLRSIFGYWVRPTRGHL